MNRGHSRAHGAWRRLALVLTLVVAAVGVVGAGVANAAQPQALIDGSTVSGGMSSEEAQFATAAGYQVTVVGDSTWGSMTAAQFGQYDLLIAGDPNCGSLPPGLVASAPVWGPVVLGHAGGRTLAGNRTIVGTDPVLHSGGSTSSPRSIVIKDGIVYAGGKAGTTGMYLDTTCAANYYGQSVQTLALVNALSEGSGAWTLDSTPPCGGSVSLIASNPSFSDLTTADLQGWGCSVHESFPTFTSDWSALAVATDTATHPTCGVDPNTGASACGEAYVLIAGSSIVVKSGSISLTPADATNPAGTDHTVTAHVTSGGNPLPGQTVTFTVTGQNAGATGTCVPAGCVSDASGNVSFTYHDANGPGDDTIKASFVDARGSLQSATAQKHWVGSVELPITASGTTISAVEGSAFSGTVATFSDPDPSATASEYAATIDWGDGSPASTGTVSGPTGGPFTVSGSHTWADEGSSTVTVTITDVDTPSNTATATSSAKVADAALTAGTLTLSAATEGGSPTTASFSFSDANPAATVADFTATITWGDGSTSSGAVTASGGGFTVTGSHAYADEGSYPVAVAVSDDGGSTTGASGTATVADAPLSATGVGSVTPQSFSGTVATFTDGNASSTTADFTATIAWGDSSTSAGTVSGSGGSYTVAGSHTYAGTGPYTVTVHIVDDGGSTADATATLLVYGTAAGGNFVIGDGNASVGTAVTFWGAQWWKRNTLGGGSGPASFKGFEDSPAAAVCGVPWTTDPGNSTPPPAGPLPAYMAVVVSSSVSQSGSTISGNTRHVVVVKTNAGYAPDPGHAGTGTVVATIC